MVVMWEWLKIYADEDPDDHLNDTIPNAFDAGLTSFNHNSDYPRRYTQHGPVPIQISSALDSYTRFVSAGFKGPGASWNDDQIRFAILALRSVSTCPPFQC